MAKTRNREEGLAAQQAPELSFSEMIENLSSPLRRERQIAASALAKEYRNNAEALLPHVGALIDCLENPEARTRWDILDLLATCATSDPASCKAALPGAEDALFDEDSGHLRLAAFHFLCSYGSTSDGASDEVWPLLDQAIRCWHGDPEFQDMLILLMDFCRAPISAATKASLAERLAFDAENNRGATKTRAQRIIDMLAN